MQKAFLCTLLFSLAVWVNAQHQPVTMGIHNSVNYGSTGKLNYSSGIKVRIRLNDRYTFKNQAAWFAETGVDYVYGKNAHSLQIPLYVTGKNSRVLKKFNRASRFYYSRKPTISLTGKFGTVFSIQKPYNTIQSATLHHEQVFLTIHHEPLNMHFAGGWGLEHTSGKRGLIIGTGITFHGGPLFGSGNLIHNPVRFASVLSSGNYLSLDVYAIKTGRLKKFKPKPPCKCLFD